MAQVSRLSAQEQATLAETLAQKLNHYVKLQTRYSALLRTDPTMLQRMFAAAKQSQSPEVHQTVDPYCFEDVDGLLAKYDIALEQQPSNYEDCFTLVNYAFSAAILFNEHKVYPMFLREDDFKSVFDRRFAQLQADFVREYHTPNDFSRNTTDNDPLPSTAASVPVTRKITELEAQALLGDYTTLMKCTFVSLAGSEDASYWKVVSVLITPDMHTQHGISSKGTLFTMDSVEIMSFMMDSQIGVV